MTVFIATEHYLLFGVNQAYVQKLMFTKIHFSVTNHRMRIVHNNPEVKFPITCHNGTQEEHRDNSTPFLISALDRARRSMPRPGHFTPRDNPVPMVQENR